MSEHEREINTRFGRLKLTAQLAETRNVMLAEVTQLVDEGLAETLAELAKRQGITPEEVLRRSGIEVVGPVARAALGTEVAAFRALAEDRDMQVLDEIAGMVESISTGPEGIEERRALATRLKMLEVRLVARLYRPLGEK